MRVRWWCYPEDGIKTQMSTRCELDFGVQVEVEVEADVFGVGRDLWGGMCRAERSLLKLSI
jgi:hypothetical protein